MAKGWLTAVGEAPGVKGRVAVVGLVDVNLAAADALRSEFGLTDAKTGTDLEAMLGDTQPDIVFDVVVPSARRDIVLASLAHGCHVLTEKPMAATLEEAREIVAAAKAAGRVHAVVQNRRFIAGVRRIRETIESGALGELTGLYADFFIGAHFGGFRDQMQNVLLLDMSIHTLDAARYMAGADPLGVYCLETNPRGSWYAHGAAANAIFEFTDGIVFNYRGSWCAEGANTSWESAWRVVGTKGTLVWDGADNFEAHVVSGNEGFFRPLEPLAILPVADEGQTHGHASVLAEFFDAIDADGVPETAGGDNIKSLAMVFGAIESARLGQRVAITV